MLDRVVNHVAALAERREIAQAVVGRIVIEMRAGNIHPRDPNDRGEVRTGYADATPPAAAPMPTIGIPPTSVTEMEDASPVRTPAMLAPALSAAERISFDASGQSIG